MIKFNQTMETLEKFKNAFSHLTPKPIPLTQNAEVIDKASSQVCRRCQNRKICWTKNFNSTYDALSKLAPVLEEYGTALESDFPSHFAKSCIKLTHLKSQINKSYQESLRASLKNPSPAPKTQSITPKLTPISNAPESSPYSFHSATETKLLGEFHARNIRASSVVAVKNADGLLEIEVTLRQPSPSETILAICAKATNYNLRIAEIVGEESGNRHRIRIIQKPKFNLNLGISLESATPNEKCGDSYSFTKPNEGTCVLTLSDGMGNGNVAARYSGATVELIERFLHAGLSKSSSINLVNSILMLGKNTETFATIDISIINLFTGRTEFVKLGAGSSYIIRRRANEIQRISSTSLPAGILGVTDIETLSTTVTSGDYIIMISDGIENAQNLWLANFLKSTNIRNTQKLADEIVAKSKIMNHLETPDDMLALVVEIT